MGRSVRATDAFGRDIPPEKLSEVGERLGVSAERVRQIEERALAKLRHAA
jgi:DNA-directed RNA polymerase sigma subunit (sigma70/sigma32)